VFVHNSCHILPSSPLPTLVPRARPYVVGIVREDKQVPSGEPTKVSVPHNAI
jgi:hypothetical protein